MLIAFIGTFIYVSIMLVAYKHTMATMIVQEYRETRTYNEGKPFDRKLFAFVADRTKEFRRTDALLISFLWPLLPPILFGRCFWKYLRGVSGDLEKSAENSAALTLRATGETAPTYTYRGNAVQDAPR